VPAVVFLVAILILPGIPELATAPRWCLLAAVVPFVWYFNPGSRTRGHALGFLFLAWCALSLVWTFNFYDGLLQAGKFVLLGLLFCVGAARRDLNAVWVAAALGAGVNSAIMIAQTLGWDGLPQVTLPAGTFYNKNFAAEFCALALVGAARWPWLALIAAPGAVLGQSKTVFLALGCALILLIWQKNKVAAAFFGVVLSAFGAIFGGYTFIQRTQMWEDTMAGVTFWGRGIGSFWVAYPEYAKQIDSLALRPTEAHNDMLQLLYELGPGSLVLVALLAFALRGPLTREHYVTVAFLVIGLAAFPLYMPATAMLAALAVGHLCRDRVELRSSVVERSSITFAVYPLT
jgi:hypothetical protein